MLKNNSITSRIEKMSNFRYGPTGTAAQQDSPKLSMLSQIEREINIIYFQQGERPSAMKNKFSRDLL
ncbi:hypothetical protein SAMN05444410_11816 [Hydrobacter penzbergensis]|uniref:Uncharacterized protein n=1 Tax=Hydrobacter penzbergensis TaxID=1235997 RepID=A0A8X8IHB9_9BACT|nr:hypothetical protein SAMN05444410_11816 [Hydrobacter penzbergensis]